VAGAFLLSARGASQRRVGQAFRPDSRSDEVRKRWETAPNENFVIPTEATRLFLTPVFCGRRVAQGDRHPIPLFLRDEISLSSCFRRRMPFVKSYSVVYPTVWYS
jgi:hypothetical protein